MSVEIITTADGSHSLFHPELNETYHSRHGALQESQHVFIEHGLKYFAKLNPGRPIRVFEVGFGTGLNALLAWQWSSEHHLFVDYVTIEAFPISYEVAGTLNYARLPNFAGLTAAISRSESPFERLHQCEWDVRTTLSEHFAFKKIQVKLEQWSEGETGYDVIFFDAFAPSKQPELWTNDMLGKVVERMNSGGVFVTYCAKGQVKRDLAALGLKVETLPGPPGKKEMTRGLKT